jgi:rhodanese-related sulfurtransferase
VKSHLAPLPSPPFLVVGALLAAALLAAPLPGAATSPPGPVPGIVDGATAKALVDAGAKVVDVRTPEEFASGHVPGAVNIPYEEIAKRLAEVGPKDAPVVLYCRSGRRSGIAAEELTKAGYTKVFDLQAATAWPGALEK